MTYSPPPLSLADQRLITPFSLPSLGPTLAAIAETANSDVAWGVANLATFVPFSLWKPKTVKKIVVFNGATVSGNIDVGVYNDAGTRLVSAGSTAQAGASAVQEFDVTDTALPAGQLLWMAIVLDNTTGQINGKALGAAAAAMRGIMHMGSAFPLPSTATLATPSSATKLAWMGVALETAY